MDNPIIVSPKIEDEEETVKLENETETEIVAASTSPPPIIDYEAKRIARDAKAKRKDEKTVQQVLKSLDSLKSPEEKLSAMCKKYSELLHENRQLQATVKQSEKKINMIHREKEQFRNERSRAVVAKTRMEQLCRELQKLNKAQQEETALKLRVEEEKRKEICFTFQSAFAEMNTLTNQNNEKSAKMREENLEMREKIKSVQERIELTETQLEKVRQQAKLELELAREKLIRVTLELTSEKEALMEDKSQLLMKLAKYHVRVKEHEGTEQFLRKQINIYEEKFEEFKRDVKKTTESLKNFRPESREMKKKMLKLEKETALWKQRWEKTNAGVLQMTEIKEKRDAEMITLNNKLSTLQELCKAFQRERTSLIAQLREKNNEAGITVDRKPLTDDNRKSMKQVENISKDCEKLKDNLSKLEGSLSEAVRETFRATVYDEESNETTKGNKKMNKKTKNETRKKGINQTKKQDSITCEDNEAKSGIGEKNDETSMNCEKLENTEGNKIDASEVEIAILERHETVLKDIEKVLAEQAILEAKIACVKELGKSINDEDDVIIENNVVDDKVMKLSKILQEEPDKIEIPLEECEKLKIHMKEFEKSENPLKESEKSEIPLKKLEKSDIPLKKPEKSEIPLKKLGKSDIPLEEPENSEIPLEKLEKLDIPLEEPEISKIPLKKLEKLDIPVVEPEKSEIPLENKDKIVKLREIDENIELSIVEDELIKVIDESLEKTDEIDAIMSTSEFEIVNHGSEPDTAICEVKKIALNDVTKITDSPAIELINESIKNDPSTVQVEMKLLVESNNDERGNTMKEPEVKKSSDLITDKVKEPEVKKSSDLISDTVKEPEVKKSSILISDTVKEPEVKKSSDLISEEKGILPKIEDLIVIEGTSMDNPSNSVSRIKDETIEA